MVDQDFEPFIGFWMKCNMADGAVEGRLVRVGETSLHLSPVVIFLEGRIEIMEHTIVVPPAQVQHFRVFPRELADRLIAETNAEAAKGPKAPQRPAASWGNHI